MNTGVIRLNLMSHFFETDTDEYEFRGITYVDYFNLYPNLSFAPTLAHLHSLDSVTVQDSVETSEGWRISVTFSNSPFLLDTHFHGTSTLFCCEKCVSDKTTMLAFLGCFLPTIRDDWRFPDRLPVKRSNWLSWLRRNKRDNVG